MKSKATNTALAVVEEPAVRVTRSGRVARLTYRLLQGKTQFAAKIKILFWRFSATIRKKNSEKKSISLYSLRKVAPVGKSPLLHSR